jgi:hypothetical protein
MNRIGFVSLTAAALLLVACGSGKGTSRNTAPTPAKQSAGTPSAAAAIPTLTPDLASTLQKYTLAAGDLPSGYSLGVEQQLPNETASQGFADPAAAAKLIQQSGREGGIAQQVFTTSSASELGVTVEAFKDAAGAQDWIAHPPVYPASMHVTAATLPQPLGEQSSAIHWTQNGSSGYVVNFRRGRFVFGFGLSAPTGQESLDAVLPLAKALDQKAQRQAS